MRREIEFPYLCAGRERWVQRSVETLRRIENAIGVVDPFATRLERGHITYSELRSFYWALLRSDSDPELPLRNEVDAWLFEVGLFEHRELAWFAVTLIMGDAAFKKAMTRLRSKGAAAPEVH